MSLEVKCFENIFAHKDPLEPLGDRGSQVIKSSKSSRWPGRGVGAIMFAKHKEGTRIVAAASGFEENLDNAMNHFKLLLIALGKQRINALAHISRVFFPLQKQQSTGRKGKTSGHRDYRVQARHFVAAFHISPEISGDIASLSSVFEAQFRRLSEFSDSLREQCPVFHGVASSQP